MKKSFLLVLGFSFLVSLTLLTLGSEDLTLLLEQQKSIYVLPYEVGKTYQCIQGWNTSHTHHDDYKYAVDFELPIGSKISAARAGTVLAIQENFEDTDFGSGKKLRNHST